MTDSKPLLESYDCHKFKHLLELWELKDFPETADEFKEYEFIMKLDVEGAVRELLKKNELTFQMYKEDQISFEDLQVKVLRTNPRKVFGEVDS